MRERGVNKKEEEEEKMEKRQHWKKATQEIVSFKI